MAKTAGEGLVKGLRNYAAQKKAGQDSATEQLKTAIIPYQLNTMTSKANLDDLKAKQLGMEIENMRNYSSGVQPISGNGSPSPLGASVPPLITVIDPANGKMKSIKNPEYLNPLQKMQMEKYRNESGTGLLDLKDKTPEEIMSSLKPEDQSFVQGLLDYRIDPNVASKRGNQSKQMVSIAGLVDPTYDMTQYPTRSKYRQEFSSGKIGSNVRSFNTAIQHLAELNSALPGVPSSSIKPLEAMSRGFQSTFRSGKSADVAMSKEDTALTAVAGELANIFKNSGGTDQEIEKWFKAYDKNASRESKRTFLKTGIDLMRGRIGALETDYERVMGKPVSKPLTSPESQSAISMIESSSDGGTHKKMTTEQLEKRLAELEAKNGRA